jgi:hypothetical protein
MPKRFREEDDGSDGGDGSDDDEGEEYFPPVRTLLLISQHVQSIIICIFKGSN